MDRWGEGRLKGRGQTALCKVLFEERFLLLTGLRASDLGNQTAPGSPCLLELQAMLRHPEIRGTEAGPLFSASQKHSAIPFSPTPTVLPPSFLFLSRHTVLLPWEFQPRAAAAYSWPSPWVLGGVCSARKGHPHPRKTPNRSFGALVAPIGSTVTNIVTFNTSNVSQRHLCAFALAFPSSWNIPSPETHKDHSVSVLPPDR